MPSASVSRKTTLETRDTFCQTVVSLTFWLCLLVACVFFALVSLSPKLIVYLSLKSQFEANQRRLVTLELEEAHLLRVIDAIRNDQDFSSELTRIEFDAVRSDEEIIPVSPALKIDVYDSQLPQSVGDKVEVWYKPLLMTLAGDNVLRFRLIASSTLLIIMSFVVLQPVRNSAVGTRRGLAFWQTMIKRYERQT
jgi:cell division protein FtsB